MVHGVIARAAREREHRIGERRRTRPFKAHPLIAGNVDEQAPGSKKAQLLAADEDERVVGVLQDAVDDDVMLGEGLSDGSAPSAVESKRAAWAVGVTLVVD